MNLFATLSGIGDLAAEATTLWTAVLAIGVAMVAYRIGKRIIGKF